MSSVLLFILAAALSAPADPEEQVVKSHPRVPAVTAEIAAPEQRICKQVLRTGSRLGEQRVCKTPQEWDAIRHDARQATEQKQIFGYVDGAG